MFLANTHSKGYNNTKVLLIITLILVKSMSLVTSPGQVKPKTMKLVFVASLLNMQY
jgi:hypothetical protein